MVHPLHSKHGSATTYAAAMRYIEEFHPHVVLFEDTDAIMASPDVKDSEVKEMEYNVAVVLVDFA